MSYGSSSNSKSVKEILINVEQHDLDVDTALGLISNNITTMNDNIIIVDNKVDTLDTKSDTTHSKIDSILNGGTIFEAMHFLSSVANHENNCRLITSSEIYIAPNDGNYLVIAQGGGGSGGASTGGASANEALGSGGGSGDLKASIVRLAKDENVTVTIGAGGLGVTAPSDGNNGNITSFGAYVVTQLIVNKGLYSITANDTIPDTLGWTLGGGIDAGVPKIGQDTKLKDAVLYTKYLDLTTFNKNGGGLYSHSGIGYASGGGASLLASGGGAQDSNDSTLGAGSGAMARYDIASTSGNGGNGFILIIYMGA